MTSTVPFRLKDLDHVVLRVADIDKALGFYCGALGCVVERKVDDIGLIQLRAGAALVDIVGVNTPLGKKGGAAPAPKLSAGGRNMDHFALTIVPFDAAAIKAHLQAHGIEAGDAVRRYGAEGDGPSIYIEDPDGNIVELKGPPEPETRLA